MKARLSNIIALFAIITIGIIACNNGDNGSNTTHIHDWNEWTITTPATCTTAGEETRTCKLDATHTETQAIAALGHDWSEWVVTTPPTTTAEGVETRTCKRDESHTETRAIPKDEPKDQTATITLSFKKPDATDADPFLTATVQGYLTNAEWDGVATKIETAINDRFGEVNDRAKNAFKSIFSRDIIIIVEAEPKGYTSWKTITGGKTVYLSLDAMNGANLTILITDFLSALLNNDNASV
jgi:hypothetical protein